MDGTPTMHLDPALPATNCRPRKRIAPSATAAIACAAALLLATRAGTALAEPTWLDPVELSTPAVGSYSPHVAVARNGAAVAVWLAWDGEGFAVEGTHRDPGETWSAPERLGPPQRYSYNVDAAIDCAGNALAVWQQDGSLVTSSRPAGRAWDQTTQPIPGTDGANDQPTIALDCDGDVTAEWLQGDHLWTSSRPAEGDWDPSPAQLSRNPGPNLYPNIAMNPGGDAVSVWTENYRVFASFKPAGGTWQETPTQISGDSEGSAYLSGKSPVAIDASGEAVVVWAGADLQTEASATYSAAGSPDGGWQPPEIVPRPPAEPGVWCSDMGAAVALDPSGNAVAARLVECLSDTDDAISLQASARPREGSWSDPPVTLFAQPNWMYEGDFDLAVDERGNAVAAWQFEDRIEASRRPAGEDWGASPWTEAETLYQGLWQGVPVSVGLDGEGNGLAAWMGNADPNFSVRAAALDAAGPALGALDVPATGTPGESLDFGVQVADTWSAIDTATWDFGDGSTAEGSAASHSYAAPGSYPDTVTATDAVGNTTTSEPRTVTITQPDEAPGQRPPSDDGPDRDQGTPAGTDAPASGRPDQTTEGCAKTRESATGIAGLAVSARGKGRRQALSVRFTSDVAGRTRLTVKTKERRGKGRTVLKRALDARCGRNRFSIRGLRAQGRLVATLSLPGKGVKRVAFTA